MIEDLQNELSQVSLIEERLQNKNEECENLSDEVESLKEQVMLHKFRLVPRESVGGDH